MYKHVSLVPSGFELMVIASCEEVSLIGVNIQGPYPANFYNNSSTAPGSLSKCWGSLSTVPHPMLFNWTPCWVSRDLHVSHPLLGSRCWDMGFLQFQFPNWPRHLTNSFLEWIRELARKWSFHRKQNMSKIRKPSANLSSMPFRGVQPFGISGPQIKYTNSNENWWAKEKKGFK